MFAVIRANQRKSLILITLMGVLLAGLGYTLAALLDPTFAPMGLLVALAVWLVLMLVSMAGGEALLMSQAGGRAIEKRDAPQLYNVVEEMQLAAGLSQPPRIFLIDSPVPNAFAVGRNEKRAAVGVTTGLLARLNRDELQGVIAHEIAHIKNRDTLFMTLAATTLGAIVILADFFLRGLRFSSAGSRRSSTGRGNQGAAVMLLLAVLLAILAPLLARLLYFACSRRREYLADASAAQFTRYPEGLASALEKISGGQLADERASRVLAPLYIISPLAARGGGGWMGTHPSTEDRIRVLRSMGGQSSLRAYEQAYRAQHRGRGILGAVDVSGPEQTVRAAATDAETPLSAGWRNARGVMHAADDMQRIDCPCGLRLRVPPAWQGTELACPRCGHIHHPAPAA